MALPTHLARRAASAPQAPSPSRLATANTAALPRASSSRRPYASVSTPSPFQHHTDDSQTPAQRAKQAHASPSERKSLLDQRRERKFAEYQSKLQLKAMQEGLSSVEQLIAQKLHHTQSQSTTPPSSATGQSEMEKSDARVAASIRARAEAEARRKLETGQLGSNPNATGDASIDGPVKPLHRILDLEKLTGQDTETIGKIWTAYHMLKGKLSAVIPVSSYHQLLASARNFPQFVLPLPREIVGGEETPANEAKQQGYEIQYLEWAFVPKSPASSKVGGDPIEKIPEPTTVLFTPLAEYKMRQEFARPALILSHYTDLAHSKGIVLMRGEITGAEESEDEEATQNKQDAPAPVPAPVATTKTRISQADAQLLSLMLQRFYLASKMGEKGMEQCIKLLETFHAKPDDFSVEELVKASYDITL